MGDENRLDLEDFALEVKGESRSGPVLVMMMNRNKSENIIDIIMYYLTRGKLEHVNEPSVHGAPLIEAAMNGHVKVVEMLPSGSRSRQGQY